MSTDALSERDVRALKGEALDDHLAARDLSKAGSADEKRDRLVSALRESGQLAPDTGPADGGDVLYRTAYPVDRFEHNVEGVEPITAAGVPVPADKVDALKAAAKSADTVLEEIR